MENTLEFAFENILDEFDFETVYCLMKLMNWEWDTNEGMKVPSIPQMKMACRELFNSVKDIFAGSARSGGFTIRKSLGSIQLSFVLTDESCSYSEEYE